MPIAPRSATMHQAPVTCLGCDRGEAMCAVACHGTPSDLEKLIRNGHGAKLTAISAYLPDLRVIQLLAPRFVDGEDDLCQPDEPSAITADMRCAFFDRTSRRCKVHPIKPTEGRLACCRRDHGEGLALRDEIATTWDTAHGRRLISRWRRRHGNGSARQEDELRVRAINHLTETLIGKGERDVVE